MPVASPSTGSKRIIQFPSTEGITPAYQMDTNKRSRQTMPATIDLTMFHMPSRSKRNSTIVQETSSKVLYKKNTQGSCFGSRRILETVKEQRRSVTVKERRQSVVLAGTTEKLSAIQQKILYGTFEYDHRFNGMMLVSHINSRNYRLVIENAKLKFERSQKQAGARGSILNSGIGDLKRGGTKPRRKKAPRKQAGDSPPSKKALKISGKVFIN
jgi:hypothetical protein